MTPSYRATSARFLIALFALGLAISAGCSSQEAVGTTPSDAGMPSSGGDFGVAPPPIGDSLPTGAISFFNLSSCPPGWQPFAGAAGRTIVPGGELDVEATAGEPLSDSEDREHGHDMGGNLPLSSVTYAGIAGEANHGVAHDGMPPISFTSKSASSGLPYVQLLVCQKLTTPVITQKLVPSGTLMFFATTTCPDGWGQTMATQGRIPVGLPAGGTPDQSFGGAPLTSTAGPGPGPNQGEVRTHHHVVQGSIQTNSHGIALLSGGLAEGYAKNTTYPYQTSSAEAPVDLPYIMLLQCQKL
jgi:hypothetical protein